MKSKLKQIKEMYQISGYSKKFVMLLILIIGSAILEIITIPYLTKQMINQEIPSGNIKALIIYGCIYIVFITISCYLVLKHCNTRSILKRKIQRDLREKIFHKMEEIKTKFYDEHETGEILQFLQTDVNEAGAMFAEVVTEMYIMGLLRFSIIAIFLMLIDLKITISILALYGMGYLVTIYFNRKTIQMIHRIRTINIELYSKINEGIQGFLTIKVLNIVQQKEKELKEALEEYRTTSSQLEKIVAKYKHLFAFIVSLSIAIIMYYGGIRVAQGTMAYFEIMLLIEYSGSLEYEFNWFIKHLTNFNKSFVSFSKILNFLKLEDVEKVDQGEALEKIDSIEFSHVYFSYTGYQKNTEDLSFALEKGDKLALVGRTGAGKTTVANLVCRFYEPEKGTIKINHKDYLQYSISSLRNKIGYVMQDTCIFGNTIMDNIRYVNPNITEEEIQTIFKVLKLHDKIMAWEDGYATDIFSNPDLLSTGEKQMLNFARVMATDCDVVILDEVTSALSYESEMLVNNAIKEVSKNKIMILIAHRLSSIKNCNKILLMKEGKIIEEGSHEQLMAQKKEYYKLVNNSREVT